MWYGAHRQVRQGEDYQTEQLNRATGSPRSPSPRVRAVPLPLPKDLEKPVAAFGLAGGASGEPGDPQGHDDLHKSTTALRTQQTASTLLHPLA